MLDDWLMVFHFVACNPFVTPGMSQIFFVIQGAFFNDMRDESALDLSFNIREFCQKHSIKVPPPTPSDPPAYPSACSKPAQVEKSPQSQPRAHKMEEITFDDLFLRVRPCFTWACMTLSDNAATMCSSKHAHITPTSLKTCLTTATLDRQLPCQLARMYPAQCLMIA